jgi:hypothetical protein
VPGERVAHLVEVVLRELLRIVELVVVHEVTEAGDRARHLHRSRLADVLGLVAARNEARDHRAESPDSERSPHAVPPCVVDAVSALRAA